MTLAGHHDTRAAVGPERVPAEVERAASRARPARVDRALLCLAGIVAVLVGAMAAIGIVLNRRLQERVPAVADSWAEVVVSTVFLVLLLGLALIVIGRARRNAVGWLLLALILLGTVEDITTALAQVGLRLAGGSGGDAGVLAGISESLQRPEFGLVFAILLLFPTGRPPSVRWQWLVWALAIVFPLWFVAHLLEPDDPQEPPFRGVHDPITVRWFANPVLHYAFLPVAGGLGIAVIISLIVRYRGSGGDERQQMRWLALLAAGVPLGIVALGVAALIDEPAMETVGNIIWLFPEVGLPVAIVIAITRYRLYDLDLLVNRSVVYASLCLVVAGTYAGVVVLAARLVLPAGRTSPVVVVLATLACVAIAAPARRRIQRGVDRLFGRRAWDAELILRDFAARWQENPQPPQALQEVLATALRDPSVELGFWLRGRQAYVGADGVVLSTPPTGSGRSALSLRARDEPVALVVHDSAIDRDSRLLTTVSTSAALVVENARLQAEVLAQLGEVEASRARIVHAADAERRRVERDLHDGAQQRLVALAMRVRIAARSDARPALLDEIVNELQAATRELRELARGIHPAALSEGLTAAVELVAARSPVPVYIDLPDTPLLDDVALTAYYVIAEAVTNAVKHSGASIISIGGGMDGPTVHITVRDDGCGGALTLAGSGLAGLADRVAAAHGRMQVDSPPGAGTVVGIWLPCG